MPSAVDVLTAAEALLREGRGVEALEVLEAASGGETSAERENLRGRVLVALHRRDDAKCAFERAIALEPSFDRAYANLAKLDADAGRLGPALVWLELGLLRCGESPRLLRASANAELRLGRPYRSIPFLERLSSIEPTVAAWRQLGEARFASGDAPGAVEALLRATELSPTDSQVLVALSQVALACAATHVLGPAFARALDAATDAGVRRTVAELARDCGLWSTVERAAREWLAGDERSVRAIHMLASARFGIGDTAGGERVLEELGKKASSPMPLLELLRRRRAAGDSAGGSEVLNLALRSFPEHPNVLLAYAEEVRSRGMFAESLRTLQRLTVLAPHSAQVHSELGRQLMSFRRASEALEHAQRAMRLRPGSREFHASYAFDSHYTVSDPHALAAIHRHFGAKFSLGRIVLQRSGDLDPDRPLRIGYVSGDFRQHSVAYFITPILERQSRGPNHILCFASQAVHDEVTARIRGLPLDFRDVTEMTNGALAELIAEERVDVLIDLGGLTTPQRCGVYTRRPAPVQLSYLGYPDTTGLDCFDYRISDAVADPPAEVEALGVERVLHLPTTAWCFAPGEDVDITQPPVRPVVFGCFNILAKVTDEVLRTWAQILERVPGSRLLLKSMLLGDAEAKALLVDGMAECGLDVSRVDFAGWTPTRRAHLETHSQIDIALDPFPYAGTTTTCDAVWMGVPVVTLRGRSHAGRVGASLLEAVGHPELVAQSPEQYVAIAVELANDQARRRSLRAELRSSMLRSPLGSAEHFVSELDAVIREAWREHVADRRAGRRPDPSRRKLVVESGLCAVVPAEPGAAESLPLLEHGLSSLVEVPVLEALRGLGLALVDLASDAALGSIRELRAGVEVRILRGTDAALAHVHEQLRANELPTTSAVRTPPTWEDAPPREAAALVRTDRAFDGPGRAWLARASGPELRLVWTVREGDDALVVAAAIELGLSAWLWRPGLGAFSDWRSEDAGAARRCLLLTGTRASDELLERRLATTYAATCAPARAAHTEATLERRESSGGRPPPQHALATLLAAELPYSALEERLSALEEVARLEPALDDLQSRLCVARALVQLGRPHLALAKVRALLESVADLSVHGAPLVPPLPSQGGGVLEDCDLDLVEQLLLEAIFQLSPSSPIGPTQEAGELLLRYQSLGGTDLAMAKRLGVFLARAGKSD